jgi:hypothetical protein
MPTVNWKSKTATTFHNKGGKERVRLNPGENEVTEEQLAGLRAHKAYPRLTKKGPGQKLFDSVGEAKERVKSSKDAPVRTTTVGATEPGRSAVSGAPNTPGLKATSGPAGGHAVWDPKSSDDDLNVALATRGLEGAGKSREQILEALADYDLGLDDDEAAKLEAAQKDAAKGKGKK